jgi:hypothetical protein
MLVKSWVAVLLLCSASVLGVAQEKGTASAIIIDNTGSMREYLDIELAIGGEAVRVLSPRGPVSIFSFEHRSDNGRELGVLNGGSGWLTENRKLWRELNAITVESGQTQLIDAIDRARAVVAAKVSGEKLAEGIVFICTDGEDRDGDAKITELIEKLKRDRIKVFAVGLGEAVTQNKSTQLLKQLAAETGGNVIFPKLGKDLRYEPLITAIFSPMAPGK